MSDLGPTDRREFEDLMRELRELKQFIEDFEDDTLTSESRERVREDDRAPGAMAGLTEDASQTEPDDPAEAAEIEAGNPAETPPPIPREDELPLLNQVVHRPGFDDDGQLDLLSVAPIMAQQRKASTSERPSDTEAQPQETPVSRKEDSSQAPPLEQTVPIFDPPADPEPVPAGSENIPRNDEELEMFVLDLSDRIMDVFEDRLSERSGEAMPSDLREEVKSAVAELLFEWVEH